MIDFSSKNNDLEISRTLHSRDGGVKYILNTQDKRAIEAIYFPFNGNFDGEIISANVVCLSSQVGCPVGCTFCETGRMKNPRNLSKEELISQLNLINSNLESSDKPPIDSVAMMGMGEPLLNLDNLLSFYNSVKENNNIKRFSVSTVGIIPGIKRLRESGKDIKLYISIHSPFNEERSKIIPVSKVYPIHEVVVEGRKYAGVRSRSVVANYVLISGVNDSERHSMSLSQLLDPAHFDITLNLLNPTPGSELSPSSFDGLNRFKQGLEADGYTVDTQLSKGVDISGGCGQLVENTPFT